MFLDKVFDDLVYGGLRHVYLNMDNDMTVGIEHRREMTALVSTVLTDLHTKLFLKYGQLVVRGAEQGELVKLISNNPKVESLIDNVDNLIEAIRFTYRNEDGSVREIDTGGWGGISRVSHNEFHTGASEPMGDIYVDFRADHAALDMDKCVHRPESVWIELPNSLYNALLLGVCARKLGTTGLPQTGSNRGYINYYQQYQAEIQNAILDGKDIGNKHLSTDQFHTEGWV